MSKSRAKRKRRRRETGGGARAEAEARQRAPGGGRGARSGAEARQRATGGGRGARAGAGRRATGSASATAAAAGTTPDGGSRRGEKREAPPAEPAGRPSRYDVRDAVARPDAIWSPFPLTEIGMAVGLVIIIAGLASDGRRASWLLSIGVVVLSVVAGELCLREHFAGFRSHTLLLAVLPVTIAHAVLGAVTDAWSGPAALAVDLALAGALGRFLHARFRVACERARGPRKRDG